MQIVSYTLADEGRVLALLQPHFGGKLNPRRISEWIAGQRVQADQPVPMLVRQSIGVSRRFLDVRGLPGVNETPQLATNIEVHNQKRAILPIAGFEYDHLNRKPHEPYRVVMPGEGRDVFFIAGTYDFKPGSNEQGSFYPTVVPTKDGLGHVSDWEPLFIDPHDAPRWLDPWHNPDFDLKGRQFGFFRFGKADQAA